MSESKEEMTVNVPDEALQAFKDLKLRRKLRYIVYTVADRTVTVESTGPPSESYAHLLDKLPHSACRFVILDHEFQTPDHRKTSKLFFITWIPATTNPKEKMLYTYAKKLLRSHFSGSLELNPTSAEELQRGIGVVAESESDGDEW